MYTHKCSLFYKHLFFFVLTQNMYSVILYKKNKRLKEGNLMTKNYRIKSRLRFTLFIAITIILFTMTANFALGINTADSSTIPEYIELEVSYGDTLWSIADRYMDDDDIRESVYKLCKLNNIKASDLQAGMTVIIPVD